MTPETQGETGRKDRKGEAEARLMDTETEGAQRERARDGRQTQKHRDEAENLRAHHKSPERHHARVQNLAQRRYSRNLSCVDR